MSSEQLNRIETKLNTTKDKIVSDDKQLNRIEAKLDRMLVTAVENKANIANHIKLDAKKTTAFIALGIFVFSMHAVAAVEFVKTTFS